MPATEPLPDVLGLQDPPAKSERGWERCAGLALKCMSGEDEGMETSFKTSSAGGKRAIQTLADAIIGQINADQSKPVPVCVLETESYQHKKYGKIFTPVFKVLRWMSLDGEAEPVASVEAEPATAEPTRRRRRG